ncbi:hypothetical protein CBR_g55415 [Chara braunii]|uniref:Uncharacterized protein n=1 Tax=Chara braunii TaxID=69332 RepID=A0A388K7P1_CHABU|nr:hypothetical protein CBR_g55415 [Chara braunii]|eukprot:GBG66072.1 hypothetical protein CBR_g55415 [Chara braunii]
MPEQDELNVIKERSGREAREWFSNGRCQFLALGAIIGCAGTVDMKFPLLEHLVEGFEIEKWEGEGISKMKEVLAKELTGLDSKIHKALHPEFLYRFSEGAWIVSLGYERTGLEFSETCRRGGGSYLRLGRAWNGISPLREKFAPLFFEFQKMEEHVLWAVHNSDKQEARNDGNGETLAGVVAVGGVLVAVRCAVLMAGVVEALLLETGMNGSSVCLVLLLCAMYGSAAKALLLLPPAAVGVLTGASGIMMPANLLANGTFFSAGWSVSPSTVVILSSMSLSRRSLMICLMCRKVTCAKPGPFHSVSSFCWKSNMRVTSVGATGLKKSKLAM